MTTATKQAQRTHGSGWIGRAEYSSQDRADYYRNVCEGLERDLQQARKANDDLVAALHELYEAEMTSIAKSSDPQKAMTPTRRARLDRARAALAKATA